MNFEVNHQQFACKLPEHRREIFEDRVVRMVFKASGLQAHLAEVTERAESDLGTRLLRLKWFNGEFPDYPLKLGVSNGTPEISLGWTDLWSPLKRHPVYSAYREHPLSYFAFKGDGYFGLAFYGPTVGPMLVHSDFPRDRSEEMETRIIRHYGRLKIKLVIEPLEPVLNAIKSDWFFLPPNPAKPHEC